MNDQTISSMAASAAYNASGVDTDILSAALLTEAFGYGCQDNGLSLALAAHMWTVAHPIGEFGSEDQKRRYLPGLCDGGLIGCHAVTEPEAAGEPAEGEAAEGQASH